jgi:hypothetical protein
LKNAIDSHTYLPCVSIVDFDFSDQVARRVAAHTSLRKLAVCDYETA